MRRLLCATSRGKPTSGSARCTGTLYRHFPTREALLETLLREGWEALAAKARVLETTERPDDALRLWLYDFVTSARAYRGVIEPIMGALEDTTSELHAACAAMRSSGTRLLRHAQTGGTARGDLDGTELFALAGALAWVGEQPALTNRADRLFDIVIGAVFTAPKPRRRR